MNDFILQFFLLISFGVLFLVTCLSASFMWHKNFIFKGMSIIAVLWTFALMVGQARYIDHYFIIQGLNHDRSTPISRSS